MLLWKCWQSQYILKWSQIQPRWAVPINFQFVALRWNWKGPASWKIRQSRLCLAMKIVQCIVHSGYYRSRHSCWNLDLCLCWKHNSQVDSGWSIRRCWWRYLEQRQHNHHCLRAVEQHSPHGKCRRKEQLSRWRTSFWKIELKDWIGMSIMFKTFEECRLWSWKTWATERGYLYLKVIRRAGLSLDYHYVNSIQY